MLTSKAISGTAHTFTTIFHSRTIYIVTYDTTSATDNSSGN